MAPKYIIHINNTHLSGPLEPGSNPHPSPPVLAKIGANHYITFSDSFFSETKSVTKSRMQCTYVINEWSLGDHPYITSAKRLRGKVKKMATFADLQYSIYADIVGGRVGQKQSEFRADVVYGWSLT